MVEVDLAVVSTKLEQIEHDHPPPVEWSPGRRRFVYQRSACCPRRNGDSENLAGSIPERNGFSKFLPSGRIHLDRRFTTERD